MKSAIRSRLLQLAASHLNDSKASVIPADPIVTILMEGLAGELAQLHQLYEQMQHGIAQHLASVLLKNTVTTSIPGHTILHATPADKILIDPTYTFTPSEGVDYAFVPAGTFHLFPAALTHIIYPDQIVRINEQLQPEKIITEPILTNTTPQIILMVNTNSPVLTDLSGLSIYLEISEQLQTKVAPLLSIITCKINGRTASTSQGYYQGINPEPISIPLVYREQALNNYRSQTITVRSCELTDHSNAEPPAVLHTFLEKHLIELPACSWWITLEFPGMPQDWLQHIHCIINCFPVVNISANTIIHEIHPLYKVFQLRCEDDFLCLGTVADQTGKHFRQVVDKTASTLLPGEINLLHAGKRRMDQREIVIQLESCTSQLREELQLLDRSDNNNLLQILEELTQQVNYIQELIHEHPRRAPWPIIAFQPLEASTHLKIEYFTTKGDRLPTIAPFSLWQELATSAFLPGSIYNLTTIYQGTAAPGPEKQVQLFRAQLYSQNRIVNSADIELCCQNILGRYYTGIQIEKEALLSTIPGKGYEMTISVYVALDKSAAGCTPLLLEYYRKQIHQQLNDKGVGLVPYRVFLRPEK
ncbi:hypothetical protein [Chitinophaga sp. sic0106]|uniref:hypothetical protein n=1 Tax=Chitinophaga sp. sic0106 TaxID=2854785 RepID=UPI001C48E4E2|nr:hypothetical protein [Chitinophaga sp. sic0106]MBV7532258.1 hypothetical protein [Chitinophaga sp. sic0106]